jgi:hypothetical protein
VLPVILWLPWWGLLHGIVWVMLSRYADLFGIIGAFLRTLSAPECRDLTCGPTTGSNCGRVSFCRRVAMP